MKLTDLIRPIVRERNIDGLTGGGSTKLDNIATAALALSPVPFVMFSLGGAMVAYILRAGTDATASPNIIRPTDYAGGTNEKVWERFNFAAAAPSLFGDGSVSAPGMAFENELNTGWYRAGAGDVRLALTGTDGFSFLKSSATDFRLGVGVSVPTGILHLRRDMVGTSAAIVENQDTTDGNATTFGFYGNTTGVGAASSQPFAWFSFLATVHDHPTRSGQFAFNWINNGVYQFLILTGDGQIRKSTGNIEIKSNSGNGNVILTPNGTGRVQIGLDGAVATPAINFISEPTSGLYRAGAGDLRISVLSTDIARFTRGNIGSATNAASLMIGPATSVSPLQVSLSSSTAFNHILLNNPDATNSIESVIGYTTTTTGAGAAANSRVAYLSFGASQHDHATRAGFASILWLDNATARWVNFSNAAFSPGATNTIDLGTSVIKFRNVWLSGQLVGADGTISNPNLTFASETNSGPYRASAGNIRFAVLGQDITTWARATFTGVTNTAAFGIGIDVPLRPLHIRTTCPGGGNFAQILLESPDTTDGFGQIIDFLTTTTGAGAAAQVSYSYIRGTCVTHDHPTRTGDLRFGIRNAGAIEEIQFKAGRVIQSDAGDIVLKSFSGNGNVVLTANGTGRVNITGGSTKLGVNLIEASTGATVTLDATVYIPISAARFLRFGAGANQRAGDAVLVAGTVAVGCTTVSANTRVYLTRKTVGGAIGDLTYTLNAGVGFTINSANAGDTSTVSFMLLEVS